MTKMEKLLHRKRKLEECIRTLPEDSFGTSLDGLSQEASPDYIVAGEEFRKIELEIAREKLEEFLNADENFEKVVLSDNSNR